MTELVKAISELAANQGIANVISLSLIVIIVMMLRAQRDETRQQDRLITQHGLTIAQMQHNTIETQDLKEVVSTWIKTQTIARFEANEIAKNNIDTLAKNTKGVNVMQTKLDDVYNELVAMRKDIQQLSATVDRATDEIKSTVTTKTTEYEARLKEMEDYIKERARENPSILIEKPKAPGVPVTPIVNAINATKVEKEKTVSRSYDHPIENDIIEEKEKAE